jgi:hypothetical protein
MSSVGRLHSYESYRTGMNWSCEKSEMKLRTDLFPAMSKRTGASTVHSDHTVYGAKCNNRDCWLVENSVGILAGKT